MPLLGAPLLEGTVATAAGPSAAPRGVEGTLPRTGVCIELYEVPDTPF
jgi:hypothetical protein